jgi:hypothetical protein
MKVERNVVLPEKRTEAPRKPVRHAYAIPSKELRKQVTLLNTGESFLVKTPNHATGVEMQRRLAGRLVGHIRQTDLFPDGVMQSVRFTVGCGCGGSNEI